MWKGGSELQFTTSFLVDPLNPGDPVDFLDCLSCRKAVFCLREPLTFEKLTLKVITAPRWFHVDVLEPCFLTKENKKEGLIQALRPQGLKAFRP